MSSVALNETGGVGPITLYSADNQEPLCHGKSLHFGSHLLINGDITGYIARLNTAAQATLKEEFEQLQVEDLYRRQRYPAKAMADFVQKRAGNKATFFSSAYFASLFLYEEGANRYQELHRWFLTAVTIASKANKFFLLDIGTHHFSLFYQANTFYLRDIIGRDTIISFAADAFHHFSEHLVQTYTNGRPLALGVTLITREDLSEQFRNSLQLQLIAASTLRADPDRDSCFYHSPFMIACSAGHLDLALKLKNLGDQVDATDAAGQTTLYVASAKNYDDIVEFLLEQGADPTLRRADCDELGALSAFDIARKYKFRETLDLLVKWRQKVNLSAPREQRASHKRTAEVAGLTKNTPLAINKFKEEQKE
jgi:hypothetical protein